MYVASHSQSNCGQNIVNCVTFNMHQNVFAISAGWVLDPGVTEYGDTPSSAKDYEFGSTNFYAGLGIGRSRYSDFSKDSGDMNSEGWKFLVGYQLNKYLGIEGGYVNLNDMTSTLGTVRSNIDTDGWALGAVVRYPVTSKISVLGKVGGAYLLSDINTKNGAALTVRTKDDSFEPNYGLGFSYALMDNLDLRLEWERFARSRFDVDMVTAGVVIGF
jgi:opacity protein-like surface antigen